MRALGSLAVVSVALVLGLTALALPAAAQPATLPTWQVGQEVGYGVTVPLGQEVAPLLAMIEQNPSSFNMTHVQYLNFTGSFDAWVYQQVTMKTDAAYLLHTVSASGLKAHLVLNATFNNLPRIGTYTGTPSMGLCSFPTVPTAAGTVNVSLDLQSLTTSDGRTNYATANLAIQNDTTNATTQLQASANLFNIPSIGYNQTRCEVTVSYKSMDLGISVNTQSGIATLYTPALDLFQFPISDNKTWWVFSNVTSAGTETGTIDVTGLGASDEQAFFQNLSQAFASVPGLAVSGLDTFPIDLSQVSITLGGTSLLDHGRIHQTNPIPLAMQLRARQTNLYLSDSQFHEVFEIYPELNLGNLTSGLGSCPPAFAALYSPTFPAAGQGMIVGYSVLLCPGPTQIPIFEVPNVPPATARGNIQNTETNYQLSPQPGTTGNAFANFFLQSPYWGLLIIAVVVVLVVAALVVRRRGKRTATPPPPPPQGPSS